MWDTVLSLLVRSWARKIWNQENITQQDDRYLWNTWQEQAVQLQSVSVKKLMGLECVKSTEDMKCGLMVKII